MALRSGGSAGAGCGFQSTRYSARPIPCDLVRPTLDALHCVEKNNSARDVAISSSTRSEAAAVLLEALSEAEERPRAKTWFCRVPSPANVADDPSRELCTGFSWSGKWLHCTKVDKGVEKIRSRF